MQKITLETLKEFKFPKLEQAPSEYNKSNIFCFSHTHDFKLITSNQEKYIIGKNYRDKPVLTPLFTPKDNKIEGIISTMKKHSAILYPINAEWLPFFDETKFVMNNSEDDSDYVYLTNKLAEMSGRKLSKKRNLIKQITQNCTPIIKKITKTNIDDAKQVLEIWAERSAASADETDYLACLKGLDNFATLNLQGLIIYNDKKPMAMSFGEGVGDTFMLHFAKADIYCKGIYQLLFQETAKMLESKYTYINLEQDLGIPQLRQAKRSYIPELMTTKHIISLKNH